jgi:hypothetical protein
LIQIKSSGKTALIPALVGALACLFFIRSGLLVFLFLLPLGFIGYGWGPKTLWSGLIYAVLGNCIICLGLGLIAGIPVSSLLWDILYFTTMSTAFAWIILPFDENSSRIPGAYRLALGSSLGALIFIALFYRLTNSDSFYEDISNQLAFLLSLYQPANSDLMQNPQNIEAVFELMKNIIIRGGALFSAVLLLLINRQISIFLIRLFGGPRRANIFLNFYTHQKLLWALGAAALLIPVTSLLRLTAVGIILWNIITLCVMMYLAQGLGIIAYFLSKKDFPAFVRFLLPVMIVILIFSPGINAVLVGIIALLGIAENWVSFRTLKIRSLSETSGPSSTPGE